jgi:hypothetical protein
MKTTAKDCIHNYFINTAWKKVRHVHGNSNMEKLSQPAHAEGFQIHATTKKSSYHERGTHVVLFARSHTIVQ